MANPSTLVNIRDLVKANAGIKEDPNFTNTLLDRWINDGHRTVQLKLFHLGYKEFLDTDTLTLSAATLADKNVKTAPLATDCPNRMGVPNWLIFIDASNSGGAQTDKGLAYPVSNRVFMEHLRNSFLAPTDNQPLCTIMNDLIYISPSTIDAADAHYYKEVTDMAADSDTVDMPEAFVTFITLLVEMRIEDRKGKLQDKQAAMVEFDKKLSDAFQALQIQQVEEVKTESLQ